MNKNEKIVVKIEDIGVNGEGIGKVEGYTLFVKDAIIGDAVEAVITKPKKNYAYARLIQIIKSSPDRVEPKCPYHKQCGGCQIQALSYEKQLEYKKKKVEEVLKTGIDRIMLDNMTNEAMAEAVKLIDKKTEIEASGNMTLERVKTLSSSGVDYISVGELTHTVKIFDFSLINNK